eukprot:556853-Pelagomonas_calceolata.AAC.3
MHTSTAPAQKHRHTKRRGVSYTIMHTSTAPAQKHRQVRLSIRDVLQSILNNHQMLLLSGLKTKRHTFIEHALNRCVLQRQMHCHQQSDSH